MSNFLSLLTSFPKSPKALRAKALRFQPQLSVETLEVRQLLSAAGAEVVTTGVGSAMQHAPLAAEAPHTGSTGHQEDLISTAQIQTAAKPSVTYHNGPLLTQVQVQALYLGSDWSTNATEHAQTGQFESFLKYIVNSPYMDMLYGAGYGVGRGTARQGVIDPVVLNKANQLNDSTIQSDILGYTKIANALANPNAQTLYVVYVEQGVQVHDSSGDSGHNFAGYHSYFSGSATSGAPIMMNYVVVPYPGGVNVGPNQYTPFQFMTSVTTHELAEAVTDPEYPSGWYAASKGELGENGDLTAWQDVTLNGYTVQKIADKNGNAMDPNAFNVAPTMPTVTLVAANTTTVNVYWTASTGATQYYLYWYDGVTQHYEGMTPTSQLSAQFKGMKSGATEWFYVNAANAAGSTGQWKSVKMP